MSARVTREEHPLAAVVMHWVHLASFFLLAATGLLIHTPLSGAVTMGAVRQTHFIAMFVFIATTVVRVYWAFFGAGSADTGGTELRRDWRHFALSGSDWRALGQWVSYYLFVRRTRPPTPKYNPLQKLVYGWVVPLAIVVMALTGFALWQPTMAAMSWLTWALGGLSAVRLAHYFTMWVMIAIVIVHVYLAIAEDVAELPNMLSASSGERPESREHGAADA